MAKLNGIKKEKVTVDIADADILEAARKLLLEQLPTYFQKGSYITRDGIWMHEFGYDYHNNHPDYVAGEVATPKEKEYALFLKNLDQLINKIKYPPKERKNDS